MFAFGTFFAWCILLTLLAVHPFVGAIPLGALGPLILPTFKIKEDELGDELFFTFVGSEVALMILHDILFAGGTPVFSALVLLLLPSIGPHHLVTRRALPVFLALGGSTGFTLLLAFFM